MWLRCYWATAKRFLLKASPPLYHALRTRRIKRLHEKAWREWDRTSVPVPDPVKQRAVLEYAEKYGLRCLVETGTYYGDMVEAVKRYFEQIISIELSPQLYEQARERFKYSKHIRLLHGDSGAVLRDIVPTLPPTLFWLDAHYSVGTTARGDKDTPVLEELRHILSGMRPNSVVLIDDARCFGTDVGYPTIHELRELCLGLVAVDIEVRDDIIRISRREPN